MSDPASTGLRRRAVVVVLGLFALVTVALAHPPRLGFSDEIVYACIGRNLAEGRGLVASHYHPESILERGQPSLYVHMPGHPLLLAASFLVLGPSAWAAVIPSWLAYLGTALLVYAIGSRVGGERAAVVGALLCLAWPAFLSHASTAMSEATLTLLTLLFAWAWLEAWRTPTPVRGAVLGLILVAGLLHHETLLALLPAALAPAVRAAPAARARYLIALLVVLALGTTFLVWPAHLSRASHPHFATEALASGDPQRIATGMWRSLVDNALDLFRRRGGASGSLGTWIPWLGMLVPLAAARRLRGDARALLAFTIAAFGLTVAGLAPLYPLTRVGPRPLLHLTPLMATLAGVLIASIRPARLRRGVAVAAVATLAALSARDVTFLLGAREEARVQEAARSRAIREATSGLEPRSALVSDAFLYAWDAWPVTVVAFGRFLDADEFDAVDARLPLDVVALPEWGSPPRAPRVEPHLLRRGYRRLASGAGLRIYAAPRLRADALR